MDLWVFWGAFGRSKITSKSSSMRFSGKRKNLKKCCRVASKSRFAGPEVDAKMSSRSNLRPAKNASSANRRKSQISDRFGLHFWDHFGSPNRCKIVSKNESKIDTPKNRQKDGSKVLRPPLTPQLRNSRAHWEGGGDVNIPTSKTQHQANTRSNTPMGRRPGEFIVKFIITC